MFNNLSPHFTVEQFQHSDTANNLHIVNIMNQEQISNAVLLCNTILEPIHAHIGMTMDSGYRCPELNRDLRGACNSQHQYGQAADILPINMPLNVFFQKILNLHLPFDQIIHEMTWVHISYNGKNGRHEILEAYKDTYGKILYRYI
jgi:hypothetical protein